MYLLRYQVLRFFSGQRPVVISHLSYVVAPEPSRIRCFFVRRYFFYLYEIKIYEQYISLTENYYYLAPWVR